MTKINKTKIVNTQQNLVNIYSHMWSTCNLYIHHNQAHAIVGAITSIFGTESQISDQHTIKETNYAGYVYNVVLFGGRK